MLMALLSIEFAMLSWMLTEIAVIQYRSVACFRIHSFGLDSMLFAITLERNFPISLEGLPVDSKMRA